jgi:hypothetical protein
VNRSLREREITIQTPFNTNTCCTLLSNVLDPFWHLTSIIILFKHFIIKIMHWKDKISLFFSLSKEGERERERDVQTCKLRAKKWKKKPFLNIPRSWNVKETEFWYIYIYIWTSKLYYDFESFNWTSCSCKKQTNLGFPVLHFTKSLWKNYYTTEIPLVKLCFLSPPPPNTHVKSVTKETLYKSFSYRRVRLHRESLRRNRDRNKQRTRSGIH